MDRRFRPFLKTKRLFVAILFASIAVVGDADKPLSSEVKISHQRHSNVYEPIVHFNHSHMKVNSTNGSVVCLTAKVTGKHPMKFKWTKGGKSFRSKKKYKIHSNILCIKPPISAQETDRYTLQATNGYGSNSGTIYFLVKEHRKHYRSNSSVHHQLNKPSFEQLRQNSSNIPSSESFNWMYDVESELKSKGKTTYYVIVGATGGGILLFTVVVITVCIIAARKRKRRKKEKEIEEMKAKDNIKIPMIPGGAVPYGVSYGGYQSNYGTAQGSFNVQDPMNTYGAAGPTFGSGRLLSPDSQYGQQKPIYGNPNAPMFGSPSGEGGYRPPFSGGPRKLPQAPSLPPPDFFDYEDVTTFRKTGEVDDDYEDDYFEDEESLIYGNAD